MQVLSVRIDDALVHEFEQMCDGLGTNRADFIRELIRQAIDDPKRAASVGELAFGQARHKPAQKPAQQPSQKDIAEARDFAFAAAAMSFFVLSSKSDPQGYADVTLESLISALPSAAAGDLRTFIAAFAEREEQRVDEGGSLSSSARVSAVRGTR